MTLDEIRTQLTELHDEAAKLLSAVLHTRPSPRLVLVRKPLQDLGIQFDLLLRRFVSLDAELIRHASPPSDINTALRNSAQFGFYTAVRDSVRGLLFDTSASTGSLRNRLDFLGSLWLSVLALIVAVVALFR